MKEKSKKDGKLMKRMCIVSVSIKCINLHCKAGLGWFGYFTVNFLNIRTPKQFVVITLKVGQDGFSLE